MKHSDLTIFRLKLSEEALEAAKLLLENKKYRTAVNRMYFAVYYKILALADNKHCETTDYRELKQWIEKKFVDKKTFFDSDVLIFKQIFHKSQDLDFLDFSEISETETTEFLKKTKLFIGKIEHLLSLDNEEPQKEEQLVNVVDNKPQKVELKENLLSEKILVPWDFSEIAENALEHAIQFAEITGGYITLVHLVKRQKEVAPALKRLTEVADLVKSKFDKVSEVVVREGNIFNSINDIATEMNAKMVIMGTHGITGMQKYTGSKALKVIAGTQIPFVVIQDKPEREHIRNIILPIDSRKEIRQKMNQVRFISKHYSVKFHLCVTVKNQLEGTIKKLNNNIIFIQAFMKQNGIAYELHEFKDIKEPIVAITKLSEQVNPDLILIITTKNIATTDYILGAEEQKIIANNQKIPVMCISPIKAKSYSYSSGYK